MADTVQESDNLGRYYNFLDLIPEGGLYNPAPYLEPWQFNFMAAMFHLVYAESGGNMEAIRRMERFGGKPGFEAIIEAWQSIGAHKMESALRHLDQKAQEYGWKPDGIVNFEIIEECMSWEDEQKMVKSYLEQEEESTEELHELMDRYCSKHEDESGHDEAKKRGEGLNQLIEEIDNRLDG